MIYLLTRQTRGSGDEPLVQISRSARAAKAVSKVYVHNEGGDVAPANVTSTGAISGCDAGRDEQVTHDRFCFWRHPTLGWRLPLRKMEAD